MTHLTVLSREHDAQRTPPAHPVGWYVVAFSDELAKGDVLTRKLAGQELVLFRTSGGEVAATRAHCPHLGAHLGHGGEVVGDTLRCPFHRFRFDTTGACVEGYPGKKVPPACRMTMLHVQEKNGTIVVFWHPAGEAPDWEVPELEQEGWRPLRHVCLPLSGHPQECSENSVDFGHFAAVHGYGGCEEVVPAHVEGRLLHAKYDMERRRPLQPVVKTSFELWVWGLGYSIVSTGADRFGVSLRTFVLPCPTDDGRVDLRLAISLKHLKSSRDVHPLARFVPKGALERVLEEASLKAYVDDVKQDFAIWENKAYLDKPRLAAGDGPVGLYRKYARQFYPGS
ncbi:MAG: Rieske 2Fe-2S domain-containing protein [Sandaracinaceae bacterium]